MPIIGTLPTATPESVGLNQSVSALNVGPIESHPYDLQISGSDPSSVRGFSAVTFSGTLENEVVAKLREFVRNPAERTTVGGATGVPAYVRFSSPVANDVEGYYLLTDFRSEPSVDPLFPYAPFSLQGIALVGLESTLEVPVSSTGHSVVALPPSSQDVLGKIRVLVDGMVVVRDYDPVLEQP